MRLSWNEIRARAAAFAEDWKDARYEKGETQSFYDAFFGVFGVSRRRVASFEHPVKLLGDRRGFIDLFWKGVLLVEQKSAGRDLKRARTQALEYFPGLKEPELPRYLLVSDFQTFDLTDLETGEGVSFRLDQLAHHVERFGFIMGVERRSFRDQDPANVLAAELLGKLHDSLKDAGYDGHDLERFLVRLLFCLFADSTGIFETRGAFEEAVRETREDGADTGSFLIQMFEVLNRPEAERQKALPDHLAQFPYVNGDLFAERLRIPAFDAKMRGQLLEACGFNWEKISPAIFGSLFQSVMDRAARRKLGAHYTTEKNILKVIEPLFLDDLRAELAHIRGLKTGRRQRLKALHEKLAAMRFFDPACGCGNFLVIAYRELRQLELEILNALRALGERDDETLEMDVTQLSRIDVDQFYGIEIEEFPARIAETAMWMMDHIMNNALSAAFGRHFARIPLKKSPVIVHADALETGWADVLPPEQCSFILGNPPFIGAKFQSDVQRAQVRRIAALGGSGGTLDYVCAWFLKAGEYVRRGAPARIGFVATNSITQGEQVAQLWPLLFDRYRLEIAFAHRTFAWGSDARGMAHVHVVVIGLTRREDEPEQKRLFAYDDIKGEPHESRHAALSPYLIDASGLADRHIVIERRSTPICDVPVVRFGSQPIDGGHLIFEFDEGLILRQRHPELSDYIRPFIGAQEFLNGGDRWILALRNAPLPVLQHEFVIERLKAVRQYRSESTRKATRDLAAFPSDFAFTTIPEAPFLALPSVTSERREYAPIGWLEPPTIPSNLMNVALDAERWHFAVLTSAMHMAWLREIGGRLKSDYRYSIGIVYNTFPWPELKDADRARLNDLGQAVLDARAAFPEATLADLYDPDVMPAPLRRAHQALDRAVDRLYRKQPFEGDRERVEHLFALYERLRAPVIAAAQKKPRRRRG
ncbi:MAG: class I SAM-dependent DNA methyltransferase [Maricaulaceae bacterium]|nr:class I SAM-dependent DNA methyltransferase [Maricaulaceae bacterium]